MTVETQPGSRPWEQYGGAGTEDVGVEDIRIPRLKIDGVDVTFINSATNEAFEGENTGLNVVMLGMIKQRAWFGPMTDSSENKPPICKSNDFISGFPSDPEGKDDQIRFPWESSGFDTQNLTYHPENGRVVLACEQCKFQQWGADRTPPVCKELHTYPLLYQHPATGDLVPAVLSVKSSAIKNSRAFVAQFATQGRPLFTFWTHLSLTPNRRGSVRFAVPNFKPLLDNVTDQREWDSWFEQYKSIRDMLRSVPRAYDDNDSEESSTPNGQQAAPAQQSYEQYQAPDYTTQPPSAPPLPPQAVVISGTAEQSPAPAPSAPAPAAPPSTPHTGRVAPPPPTPPQAVTPPAVAAQAPSAPPSAPPAPAAPGSAAPHRVAPPAPPSQVEVGTNDPLPF